MLLSPTSSFLIADYATPSARLVKLADKICNLREIKTTPPADWSMERKRDYFLWARQVVKGLRGTNEALERVFDDLCRDAVD